MKSKFIVWGLLLVTLVVVVIGGIIVYRIWSDSAERRAVEERVVDFGTKLNNVSLLAPQIENTLQNEYGAYVTPELLARWQKNPKDAPGRLTSSPWPARIEVHSVRPLGQTYFLEGTVVYVTSNDSAAEESATFEHVAIVVEKRDESWRIADYTVQKFARGTLREATSTE